MSEGFPRQDEIDQPLVDPNQVAEAAALEDPQITEGDSKIITDMQEDTHHSLSSDQAVDDSIALDSETKARIQELRDRGRVGVLTENTERPDSSDRMKNSDHDPDAIATVNKANRLTRQEIDKREDGYYAPRANVGETFRGNTDMKLNAIAKDDNLRKSFEDPDAWEAGLRRGLEDLGENDERIESQIDRMKRTRDYDLERIGEEADYRREDLLRVGYDVLHKETIRQDQYRGDLLGLYDRDPEKYKAMPTEEFIAEGRKFQTESFNASRLATLEAFGKTLQEELPGLVENATSVTDFCHQMDEVVNRIRWQLEDQGSQKELYGFLEALEGKEVLGMDALPVDRESSRDREQAEAVYRGEKARKDTKDRLYSASMHGYFRPDNFASDLDRSPREQMREAVERAKLFTDKWVEDGQKARDEFDEKWGKNPEEVELETDTK